VGLGHAPGIVVENLAARFDGEPIFERLGLSIPAGSFTALLGPSGVGKTTLLRIIAGLEAPAAGTVTATDAAPLTGRIAYMAQNDLLLPWSRAIDNVTIGARLRCKAASAPGRTNFPAACASASPWPARSTNNAPSC
jgi:putative hydroxymethylpyrimidine transport system ATP-binding protein